MTTSIINEIQDNIQPEQSVEVIENKTTETLEQVQDQENTTEINPLSKEERALLLEHLDTNQYIEQQSLKQKSSVLEDLENDFQKNIAKFLAKNFNRKELSVEHRDETFKKVISSKDFNKITDKAIKDSDILTNYQHQLKNTMGDHKINKKSGLLGSILDKCINAPNSILVKQLELALKEKMQTSMQHSKDNICEKAINNKSLTNKIKGLGR